MLFHALRVVPFDLASAFSQVSRTERFASFRYPLSIGKDETEEMALIASDAYA